MLNFYRAIPFSGDCRLVLKLVFFTRVGKNQLGIIVEVNTSDVYILYQDCKLNPSLNLRFALKIKSSNTLL